MKKTILLFTAFLLTLSLYAQDLDQAAARQLVSQNMKSLGLTADDLDNIIIKNAYNNKYAGTQMVYLQQSYLGLPVFNQLQVISFKNGNPVSVAGGRSRKLPALAGNSISTQFPAESAVRSALQHKNVKGAGQLDGRQAGNKIDFGNLGVCSETVTAELMWLLLNEGTEAYLVWQIRLVPIGTADYWLIRVDANSNKVVDENNLTVYCNWDTPGGHNQCNHDEQENGLNNSAIANEESPRPESPNLVSNASYRVIPYPAESPTHPGGTPAIVSNPWLLAPGNATSLGWHSDGTNDFSISRGNNVHAQEDRDNNNSSLGTAANSSTSPDPLTFHATPDFSQAPIVAQNQQFSITNLFYWNNIIHNLSYIHGFDEPSGNFQTNNQGRGGLGNDHVIADCQDAGGTNNANFATPDDGSRPRMQMYLWSGSPQKDGSLDNGVVTHEFSHGISNRLTGGPGNSSCLTNSEQMGEGWSDYFGLMYTQDWANSNLNTGFTNPRSVGTYAAGQSPSDGGIRTQRYCTNFSINNKVYLSSLPSSQHNRGEIWCAVLWDMTWNIINQTGVINPTLFDTNPLGGNNIALKLVIEGMKLQPCNPGFIQGRDAILKADSILYGGQYSCAIREAFRRRGMGALASQGSSNSLSDQVPDFSGDIRIELSQGGVSAVPEGQQINYNISVSSSCQPINNCVIRDTLPDNVTYVSGGSYNAANRVVSFTVNQAAGTTQNYQFTVRVNNGTYFAPSNLIAEDANGGAIPTGWTSTSSTGSNEWSVSTLASKSAPSSFYCRNLTTAADQRLQTSTVTIPSGTSPRLFFWHKFNTEEGWDGGVVEVSANNGTSWNDLDFYMVSGRYNGTLGNNTANVLRNRVAFTGTIENFQQTVIDLSNFAGLTISFRFRFGSDNNTSAPTTPAGWFVDDVLLEVAPIVKMRAAIFNSSNQRLAYSDTSTYIQQAVSCINAGISTQPASLNICSGNPAVFSVDAQGTSNSYQWQVSTDGGNNFTNLAGDTLPTLNLGNVQASQNNLKYRVIISNNCPSSVTSAVATLTVSDPASIVSQPAPRTICAGLNTSFSVTASGGVNGYQWQVSSDGGNTFSNISGANASSLSINNVTVADSGKIYRVKLNSCNEVFSLQAPLNVLSAPQINSAPQSVTVCTGNNHTFNVNAAGSGLTYQWQISTNGGSSFSNIPGATGASYGISGAGSSLDNNQYRVVVSGSCPSPVTSDAAVLTIGAALNITAQPDDVNVCGGTIAIISVNATGAVSYQWQVSSDGGNTYTNIQGENNASLIISPVSASLQGNRYRVIIGSCSGNVNSQPAQLNVTEPVTINTQPANTGICLGGNGSISVSAAGSSLSYQWELSSDNGAAYTTIPGATGQTLSFSTVGQSLNNNRYRVVITPANPCEPVRSNDAVLTINPLPQVTATASPANEICSGAALTLSAGGAQTYSWTPSVTNNTAFTPQSSGNYTVRGTDANGCENTANISITVKPVPQVNITAAPTLNLLPGDSTTLTATSTPAATGYTWFRNNQAVAGVTGNRITVRYDQRGSYKAEAVIDGCPGQSNLLTVGDSAVADVFIYPNPNPGNFRVRLPQSYFTGTYLVTVYDSKGARIYAQSSSFSNRETAMNLRHLPAGIYMIRVWSQNGEEIRTGKVAIIK